MVIIRIGREEKKVITAIFDFIFLFDVFDFNGEIFADDIRLLERALPFKRRNCIYAFDTKNTTGKILH